MKKICLILLIIVALFIINLFIKGQQSQKITDTTTYSAEQLGPCPEKPNCVSSFNSSDTKNFIEPLSIDKLNFSLEDLKLSEFKVIKKSSTYIQILHQSSTFGFVDDIEILYLPQSKTVHFRSASRVGYSDMGANRKRVEALKEQLRKL